MASPSPLASAADSTPAALVWHRDGRRLHDHRSSAAVSLDLDAPSHGIRLTGSAAAAPEHLLGLALGGRPRLSDHWIRGGDVTAVYESDDARQLRTLAMWRLQPAPADQQAWVLVLSAQTSLLETTANVGVVSRVHGDVALQAAGGDGHRGFVANATSAATTAVLVRPSAPDGRAPHNLRSILVAMHPEDKGQLTATASAGLVDVGCRLFPAPLEKGVLLRSRVLAAVGPTTDDVAWAADLLDAFAASPPLLST